MGEQDGDLSALGFHPPASEPESQCCGIPCSAASRNRPRLKSFSIAPRLPPQKYGSLRTCCQSSLAHRVPRLATP
jgi:hypothetical protein